MKIVKIGTQIWTKRNLKVDHYSNGDEIPQVQDPKKWSKLTTGAWCYFKDKKKKKYGKLYNWYAVNDPRGLAPDGWHVPTYEEFETLISTVNRNSNSLKTEEIGEDDGVGTNTSGFSALLAGCRGREGYFYGLDTDTGYWSYTAYDKITADALFLYYNDSYIYLGNNIKKNGLSIRLIKD